jgi:WhiB family redox-sensing transcriptional regulator
MPEVRAMAEHWKTQGRCLELDVDAMFVRGAAQNAAAAECKSCPVIRTCLAHALDNGEEHGVWGGQTERQRRALLKAHPGVTSWAKLLSA